MIFDILKFYLHRLEIMTEMRSFGIIAPFQRYKIIY